MYAKTGSGTGHEKGGTQFLLLVQKIEQLVGNVGQDEAESQRNVEFDGRHSQAPKRLSGVTPPRRVLVP